MRYVILTEADLAGRTEFAFVLAAASSNPVKERPCPEGPGTFRIPWRPGQDLLLPQGQKPNQPFDVFLVTQSGGCSHRTALHFDPREVGLSIVSKGSSLGFRLPVADLVGETIEVPYFDETGLDSPRARCSVEVVEPGAKSQTSATAVACSKLLTGIEFRVPASGSLPSIRGRFRGVPFRLRLQSEPADCSVTPGPAGARIEMIDRPLRYCAYELFGTNQWRLVTLPSSIENLRRFKVDACAGNVSCAPITERPPPNGSLISLRIGGGGSNSDGPLRIEAKDLMISLGEFVRIDIPGESSEHLLAPNPHCAVPDAGCDAKEPGWLCIAPKSTLAQQFAVLEDGLSLAIDFGIGRFTPYRVQRWERRGDGSVCPVPAQHEKELSVRTDAQPPLLDAETLSELRNYFAESSLRVAFTFRGRQLLVRELVSGNLLDIGGIQFGRASSKDAKGAVTYEFGTYDGIARPFRLDGKLCVVPESSAAEPWKHALFVPGERFAVVRQPRSPLPATLRFATGRSADTEVARIVDSRALAFVPEGERYCAVLPRDLKLSDDHPSLAFEDAAIASTEGAACTDVDRDLGRCTAVRQGAGGYSYPFALNRFYLFGGVSSGLYTIATTAEGGRPDVLLSGTLGLNVPFAEAGYHLGSRVYFPVVELGLELTALTVSATQEPVRNGESSIEVPGAYQFLGVYSNVCGRFDAFGACLGARVVPSVDLVTLTTPTGPNKSETHTEVALSLLTEAFLQLTFDY